jgi:large subunit ribosomal protein L3
MVAGLWGKKIGMTQIFKEDKVIPVTVINTSDWVVTQIKTEENDGYNAIQVGCLREKYSGDKIDSAWLQNKKKYFGHVKEIKLKSLEQGIELGKPANFSTILTEGKLVDVFGDTKGCGFAGAVKRHGFRGGSGGHGDKTGRRTGSLSFMRSLGRVIKGKRLPGHMGTNQVTMKNLEIVKIDPAANIIAVKGSVPGKPGSLIYISRHG